jgi:cell division protein FtsB
MLSVTHTLQTLSSALSAGMPDFDNGTLEVILYITAGAILLFLGYRGGRFLASLTAHKTITQKEQELFTSQKGFKNLYEQELAKLKAENEKLAEQVKTLTARAEEYRKKAAGFGGLFGGGGKRADAMYALLLENEALEEALYAQNEKLRQERTDALKEQLRSTGYRRVLMSQLLNDNRIKDYVREIVDGEKLLAAPPQQRQALPHPQSHAENGARQRVEHAEHVEHEGKA